MDKWEKIRKEEFSLSDYYIYMNNSTLGATINRARKQIASADKFFAKGLYIDEFLNIVISHVRNVQNTMKMILTGSISRSYQSKMMVGFTVSATESMSFVANGLDLVEEDTVLTTDHEHSGTEMPWKLK